jgi:hypothetical protein
MILLIQLVLLGPALKASPVLKDHPVPLVMVKAEVVVEVVEEAAVVMVVWQVLLTGPLLWIPTSVFLFRLLPHSGTPSTSGIDILQLLILPSRISGTRTPLMGPIRPNSICSSPSAIFISLRTCRISPPMTTKSSS